MWRVLEEGAWQEREREREREIEKERERERERECVCVCERERQRERERERERAWLGTASRYKLSMSTRVKRDLESPNNDNNIHHNPS
jgi:hypothetical protein